ncbi:ATP-dependent endonuclease [Roseomonas nepalensis]|uniref:DNA 3'-5' helicase n=1 Tax=Muricoccus nepalensis TaxID=1854500 RepID=A0A502FX58_9PROT|nr:UvrD-helicase domain-containing protein [Roseomonas nepalensis]TPG53646.1 ATP-dependent endonuclease [Roseomonas nepalensis]
MPLDSALLEDAAARSTALTAIDRTLLVQAGAGSGKTSVLAGRVVVLLATGRHPSEIAAISFTEFSASELRERIVRFVDLVADGAVPRDLEAAFPSGPDEVQRANLRRAREDLDCLACTTIHGFCRMLLAPYPVEAGIDPGAALLDQDAAELMLDDEFAGWLRDRLSGEPQADDAFAALYLADPSGTADALRKLAGAMRARRGADVEDCSCVAAEALDGFRSAVSALRAFVAELAPGRCIEKLPLIVDALEEQLAALPTEETASLPWFIALRPPGCCSTAGGDFNASSRVSSRTAWQKIIGGGKGTQAHADELSDRTIKLYEACRDAHGELRSAAAGRILHILSGEARQMLERFDAAKRDAAALDFDDLLEKTRLLLARNPEVRAELASRFRAVLVDEFQDTDPVQLEILWHLCGDPASAEAGTSWTDMSLRGGSLFLVGDAKQSIFRFRGADLAAFLRARQFLLRDDPSSVLSISRNFRSRVGILEYVNERFRPCLSADGQAGFADLTADGDDLLESPGVAGLLLELEKPKAAEVRDKEADEVAKLCLRLVGSAMVRDRGAEGGLRPCEPRDIALLSPTGTDLWRYERALEDAGLTVATQAGKGFYRRQEVQDLIALARVLADSRDRLALGALLRGPMVGFPDEVLLDAVAAQPPTTDNAGRPVPAQLGLHMDPDLVPDEGLRGTLVTLASLARRKRICSPHILLCRAVERLNVRAKLRQRGGRVAELALANVDLFLEMSRAYDVRGIRAFAERMRQRWEAADKSPDARPDADLRSVSLVTMHAAKGLEWPVVIPVNTSSELSGTVDYACDELGRIHMAVYGIHPWGCGDALTREEREVRFERERLWYVAATRPRDLLMVPRLPGGPQPKSWAALLELGLTDMACFGDEFPLANIEMPEASPNLQDRTTFDAEADRIMDATPRLRRLTPHLAEQADAGNVATLVGEELGVAEVSATRGGLARGLVLHKLLEEVLTGETSETKEALAGRGAELLAQVALAPNDADTLEMADAVMRGLAVPEIAAVRSRLVPEWPVAVSRLLDGAETVILGVADAVVLEPDGGCSQVIDWKSDVAPSEKAVTEYCGQLSQYLGSTGATEGLLVFLSPTPPLVVRIRP